MNVSAIIVTRGDVDLNPILDSLPPTWQRVVYDNGANECLVSDPDGREDTFTVPDVAVFGRYAAVPFAGNPVIYVQDDDCIVSDPAAIVNEWIAHCTWRATLDATEMMGYSSERMDGEHVVCNMPAEFRHDGYIDSALVGFGAAFHRDAPVRAFDRYCARFYPDFGPSGADHWRLPRVIDANMDDGHFLRTCDVVFTTLTTRVLVDVPKVNREFAEDASRMYRTPGHVEERQRMLELARQVRDA